MTKTELFEQNAYKLVSSYITKNSWVIDFYGSHEDTSQELLMRIWERLEKYNKKKGAFSTFVFKVCVTSVLLEIRKRNCQKRKFVCVNFDDVEFEICDNKLTIGSENDFDKYCLSVANENLGEISKEYYLKGKKQLELSKEYGIPQVKISRIIQKDIANLQNLLLDN